MATASATTTDRRTALCQLPHSGWPVGVVVLEQHEITTGGETVTVSIENPVSFIHSYISFSQSCFNVNFVKLYVLA